MPIYEHALPPGDVLVHVRTSPDNPNYRPARVQTALKQEGRRSVEIRRVGRD